MRYRGTQVGWIFTDLHPSWLNLRSDRVGMGIRFLCPTHHTAHAPPGDPMAGHELRVWFLNPCDDGPPADLLPRAWRTGDTLETLTLAPEGVPIGDPFTFGPCGRFWISANELQIATAWW